MVDINHQKWATRIYEGAKKLWKPSRERERERYPCVFRIWMWSWDLQHFQPPLCVWWHVLSCFSWTNHWFRGTLDCTTMIETLKNYHSHHRIKHIYDNYWPKFSDQHSFYEHLWTAATTEHWLWKHGCGLIQAPSVWSLRRPASRKPSRYQAYYTTDISLWPLAAFLDRNLIPWPVQTIWGLAAQHAPHFQPTIVKLEEITSNRSHLPPHIERDWWNVNHGVVLVTEVWWSTCSTCKGQKQNNLEPHEYAWPF